MLFAVAVLPCLFQVKAILDDAILVRLNDARWIARFVRLFFGLFFSEGHDHFECLKSGAPPPSRDVKSVIGISISVSPDVAPDGTD